MMNRKRLCTMFAFAVSGMLLLSTGHIRALGWTPAGPLPRQLTSAVLDTTTNTMIVFGGNTIANGQSARGCSPAGSGFSRFGGG
jgi:hypothetical protein